MTIRIDEALQDRIELMRQFLPPRQTATVLRDGMRDAVNAVLGAKLAAGLLPDADAA